jgi:DNA-binding CsgD family transcriptional regulator
MKSSNYQDLFVEINHILKEATEERNQALLQLGPGIRELPKIQSEPGTFLSDSFIARHPFVEFNHILKEATEERDRRILQHCLEIRESLKRQSEPGTFLGDYLFVQDKTQDPSKREAALMRLVDRLQVYPVEPEAKRVLRHLGHKVLTQLWPTAVWLALQRMDDEQTYREGRHWHKDQQGHKQVLRPSDEYTSSQEGEIVAYLRKEVRNIIEEELIEAGAKSGKERSRDVELEDNLTISSLPRPVRGINHCKVCLWEGRLRTKNQPCPKCGLGGSLENGRAITASVADSLRIPRSSSLEDLAIDVQESKAESRWSERMEREAQAILSKREWEVFELDRREELKDYEIAQRLDVSPGTIGAHKHHIAKKLSELKKKFSSGM